MSSSKSAARTFINGAAESLQTATTVTGDQCVNQILAANASAQIAIASALLDVAQAIREKR